MACKHCEMHHDHEEHEEHEEKREKITKIVLFVFALICLIVGFILQKADQSIYADIQWSYFKDKNFYSSYSFISFILYTVGYLPLLVKAVISCYEEMKEGSIFNEFLLMIVATVGAYIINEFPETIFVLLFSTIGELLEDYATGKSRKSIQKLVNSMPLYAHYIEGDTSTIIEKTPEELQVNDLIEIRPGEKVSVDGVIVKGSSSFDFSSLNGESLPKDLKEGDKVFSGSINLSSLIVLKVEKEYKSSTLSKIMDLVENEQEKKAKAEKLITKFSKIYTPTVMLISLAVFLIGFGVSGWDFANGGKDWLFKALSILLISCPCSLVIAVPIAFFAGIGSGSKYGILIKGSVSLEQLAKSDTAVFDKTGTLTKGKFTLHNKVDEESMKLAASLESKSTHPLAKAITDNYQGDYYEVNGLNNIPGKGIEGIINNETYYIGSLDFIREQNIKVEKENTPFKVLYLANKEKGHLASFIVKDQIKEEAKEAIKDLKNEKTKQTVILSGDDENIVKEVQKEIGIDNSLYELLPEEKLIEIKKMKDEGKRIAYVGDGINDSASILASDVGIAMGGLGSDATIEASDIVILDDDLRKIPEAKRLSKKTLTVVITGIVLSIVLKLLIMALVASGLLHQYAMIVSSLSDTGVMVICVLNALRMLFYRPKYLKKK